MNKIFLRRGRYPQLLCIFLICVMYISYFFVEYLLLSFTNLFLRTFIIILILTLFIYFFLNIIRDCFFVMDKYVSLNLGRLIIPYDKIKVITFALYVGLEGRGGEYFVKKRVNDKKIYIADIGIYINNNFILQSYYSKRIVNTELYGMRFTHLNHFHLKYKLNTNFEDIKNINECVYDFSCYDFDSIKDMIEVSQAKIYVTKSYLYFNKWTVNEFARKIDVDVDRITMINDDPLYNLNSKQIEKLDKKMFFNL